MKHLTLLERLERLNSPYQAESTKRLEAMAVASVRDRVERFLKTIKGSVLMDPNLGMDIPAVVSQRMGSQNLADHEVYMKDLSVRIQGCDRRIKRVRVSEGRHTRDQDSQTIPFLEIYIELNESLGVNEYREPFSLTLAYDYTGRVFEALERGDT